MKKKTFSEVAKDSFMEKVKAKKELTKKFSSEFVKLSSSPNFRGLWIFATKELYHRWMANHSSTLILEYNATYNMEQRKWYFPNGGTLDLQVVAMNEDLTKLKGMRYNYVEVDGKIDKEIQQQAIEFIATVFKEKS